jgi:translocation and assembly module TamB
MLLIHLLWQCTTLVKSRSKKDSSSSTISENGGSLNGQGTINLKEDQPQFYDITLTAQKFSWPIVKGIYAAFDSQLKYNGNADKPQFTGDMKFSRIQITAPVIPTLTTGNTATGRVVSFPVFKTKMDLTLTADSAIFLQTELLSLQAKGWIKVETDTDGELEITHELKTIDGYVLYQNKKFPITKAVVRHTDPKVFNPYIEAEAKTTVRSIDIIFRVYGTLNDYDLSLTSDPAYSQSDIFALLATGRTNEELRLQGKTDITSQIAAGYASEQLLNTLGSPVMKAVGIDNVTMEYDEVNNENKLKVQKQLKKKLTASYSMGLAKESDSGGELEYKLNKNLSVVGGVGVNSLTDEADGSVDLEFHFITK